MISAVERLSLLVIFIFTLISLPTDAVGSEKAILAVAANAVIPYNGKNKVNRQMAATAAAHRLICLIVIFIPAFLFFYCTFTMVTLLPPGVWLLPVSPGPPLLPPGLAGLEEELLFEEFADPVPEGVFPPD